MFKQKESKTIKKTRYIDEYWRRKIFAIYNNDYIRINLELENLFLAALDEEIEKHVMVLIGDYTQGLQ